MSIYWLTLAGMLAAGLGIVLIPIMKNGGGMASARVTLVVTVVLLPLLALLLYATVGTRPIAGDFATLWQTGRTAIESGDLTGGLAAFAEARSLAGENNTEFVIDYAEALLQANPNNLSAEAGSMIESVLEREPQNPRALWYGGLVAARAGSFERATARWRALLAIGVPDDVRIALERQIDVLESHAGLSDGPGVTVRVEAGGNRLDGVNPETPVFVLARSAQGGPPFAAVRRRVADLPFSVTLSDADAMLAGRKLSDQDGVEIVARVALGGTAQARTGDIFATVDHNMKGEEMTVVLVLDSVVE